MAGAVAEPGSFIELLAPDEQAALRALGRDRKFVRGSVLMYEGEPGERVMVIISGHVKITRTTRDGHETILSFRGPGDLLGELSCIDGQPRLSSVEAIEPVDALVIAASAFRHHLETTPRVAVAVLENLSRRFRDTARKRSQFGASDTIGRVAARLVELAERYGESCEHGVLITLPISQEELGAWTGSSRAGVAKALQTLRELHWIDTERRRFTIRDIEALRARAA